MRKHYIKYRKENPNVCEFDCFKLMAAEIYGVSDDTLSNPEFQKLVKDAFDEFIVGYKKLRRKFKQRKSLCY